MKNTFGNNICVTLFGESHGEEIGAVLDGMPAGLEIDEDFIAHQLFLRSPHNELSTERRESDEFRIVSGVFRGMTTGAPITIIIPNEDVRSGDYNKNLPRPGHADYTAHVKYHGFEDFRGGGHFSGRLTAPLVAVGAICLSALRKNHIYIGTHIASLGMMKDRSFESEIDDIELLGDLDFPTLNEEVGERMQDFIRSVRTKGDSIGGVLESCVIGLPAGLGEPWFDSVESLLSHALFSIPAVKGVEFGSGFGFSQMTGSQANDEFMTDGRRILTSTNHNGGINGGLTNAMPLMFRTCIKPTPSIALEQNTVNMETMENTQITISGRHDPCILPRARVVQDSMTAIVLCDLLATHYGTDFILDL